MELSARQESGLRMKSLSTPRRVYPKRARLLYAKAKERCDKAVPSPWNDMAALTHAYQL